MRRVVRELHIVIPTGLVLVVLDAMRMTGVF
jgi:hypothetical protein